MPRYTRAERLLALLYGIATHAAFAAGVSLMMASMFDGMALGAGRLRGAAAVAADALLVAHFPLVHSFLLAAPGRRLLARLAPRRLGADLGTTTYALAASLQLLLVFGLWSPSGVTWWRPEGTALAACSAAYAASWLFLLKAMADAGLPLQTGWLGWSAVARGRTPVYGRFPTRGLFAHLRQPVYVGFALTLWTAPCWTPDHLALAAGWTLYCLLGPRLKEARYRRSYGTAFDAYRRRVPYWMPRLRGAALDFPAAKPHS